MGTDASKNSVEIALDRSSGILIRQNPFVDFVSESFNLPSLSGGSLNKSFEGKNGAQMSIGTKFAEGGEAEIYNLKLQRVNEDTIDAVLKVYKENYVNDDLYDEMKMLETFGNRPGFIEYYGAIKHPDGVNRDPLDGEPNVDRGYALIMGKAKGDLSQIKSSKNIENLVVKEGLYKQLEGLLLATKSIHDLNIAHGDLSSKNILVSDSGRLIISDFGTAGDGKNHPQGLAGLKKLDIQRLGESFINNIPANILREKNRLTEALEKMKSGNFSTVDEVLLDINKQTGSGK